MSKAKTDKKKNSSVVIPKWMDCTWRRVPCGRDDCPICGRIKRDRKRREAAGADPDGWSAVMEDAGGELREVFSSVRDDAEKPGIKAEKAKNLPEPPGPLSFSIYRRLKPWRDDIYVLADRAYDNLEAWPMLEPGQDLLWYANTLMAKTYRQLANRWEMGRGRSFVHEDYIYTGYVLGECAGILKKSLVELIGIESGPTGKFNLALVYFSGLEREIIDL